MFQLLFHIVDLYMLVDIDTMEYSHWLYMYHPIDNTQQDNLLLKISNIIFYLRTKMILTIQIYITSFACPSIVTITKYNRSSRCNSLYTSTMCSTYSWITLSCCFQRKTYTDLIFFYLYRNHNILSEISQLVPLHPAAQLHK
jgi:hypothetical protein